ncbi:MAG: PAS domain-containing protein [Actinobacteria bacterium]|nr:PAS domain-containing protein [Actinomycetota bacterium]
MSARDDRNEEARQEAEPRLTDLLHELRETEARQRALLSVLPDLMFRLGRDGTYLEFAGDLTRLATPAEELLGANMYEILPPEVAAALMGCVERALDSGRLQTVEYRLRTLDGELRDFEARVVRAGEDEVVTIVRDVTDRKRAEKDLREARARVVAAEAAERRRLERNLHDGAQQRLVTANLNLHLVERKLAHDPDAAREFLSIAQAELTTSLGEIRQIARGLRPQALAADGLAQAVRTLVEHVVVPVELRALPSERLPEAVEEAAYYVVAESLSNVGKHSGATNVSVSARVSGDDLVVEVADDGTGGADPSGSGLSGLADRVALVGGRLDVESDAGRGTLVRAVIPAGGVR